MDCDFRIIDMENGAIIAKTEKLGLCIKTDIYTQNAIWSNFKELRPILQVFVSREKKHSCFTQKVFRAKKCIHWFWEKFPILILEERLRTGILLGFLIG